MKNTKSEIILLLCFLGFLQLLSSQTVEPMDKHRDFDFWVGEWELSWLNDEKQEVKGKNSVKKILNGVIEENFSAPNGFEGKSLTIYSKRDGKWHQTWVDNQGGHFVFEGIIEENQKKFQTKIKDTLWQMVFYNFNEEGFDWKWQRSKDDGLNWEILWKIKYSEIR